MSEDAFRIKFRAKSLRNMDITGRSKHFDVFNRTIAQTNAQKASARKSREPVQLRI